MKKILILCLWIIFIISSTSFANAGRPAPAPTGVVVPTLCYHVVKPVTDGHYQIDLASFQEEMNYLANNGYTTLSIDEYYDIISGQNTTPPSKPVLLTFDDSTSDFYDYAFPVLKQHSFKATQFAVSDWIDTAGKLTSAQIKEIAVNGIDVQNHTSAHVSLSTQTYDEQVAAINTCSAKIASITGKTPQYLAYPNSRSDSLTVQASQAAGMKLGFTVGYGMNTPSTDKYSQSRHLVITSTSMTSFISMVTP